jgi:hypothetical protein
MAFASGVGGRTPAARKAASDEMTAFTVSPLWTADRVRSTTRRRQRRSEYGAIKIDNYGQVLIQIKTGYDRR